MPADATFFVVPKQFYQLLNTVYNGYSDNGYSDILDIVILLSLSIFPHLHIRHTKFIGYSDIMVIVIIWP